jgi:hypothetical protein
MAAKPPNTFIDLVKHIETTLKVGEHFFVAYTNSQRYPVALKSLELTDARFSRKGRSIEATLILDGRFTGRHGPHKTDLSAKKLSELGITDIRMGFGASPYSNNTVRKGLTVKVSQTLLATSLADEVDRLTGISTDKAADAAVKEVEQAKAYREGLLRIKEFDKEIKRLAKLSAATKTKLEQMTVKAREKAKQNVCRGIAKASYNVSVSRTARP